MNSKETARQAAYEALDFLRGAWGLNGSQLAKLLHLPTNTVKGWFLKKRLPVGRPPEALLDILAIHRSLYMMFTEPANQLAWLRTKHPSLSFVPIEKIRESGNGRLFVRQYLSYLRSSCV